MIIDPPRVDRISVALNRGRELFRGKEGNG